MHGAYGYHLPDTTKMVFTTQKHGHVVYLSGAPQITKPPGSCGELPLQHAHPTDFKTAKQAKKEGYIVIKLQTVFREVLRTSDRLGICNEAIPRHFFMGCLQPTSIDYKSVIGF